MEPKPLHWSQQYGDQFSDASVAQAYKFRLPYPEEAFKIVAGLVSNNSSVLEIGAGTGDFTLGLSRLQLKVTAVEPSSAMVSVGRVRLHEAIEQVFWIEGYPELVELGGPYDLIVAAESLHWADWSKLFPKLKVSLSRAVAPVVVVEREYLDEPWSRAMGKLIGQFSTNQDFAQSDLIEELQRRALFRLTGEHATQPVSVRQFVGEYVESVHSRNGFSRMRMTPDNAVAFDRELHSLLNKHSEDDRLEVKTRAVIKWGLIL
jgi:SAM-dependent methyltransferase